MRQVLTTLPIAVALLTGMLTNQLLGSSAIGFAMASSSFQIDNSQVSGNATVFDGSVVETKTGFSDLRLAEGARVRLGSESRATVYRDRIRLEKGMGEVTAVVAYSIETERLRITPNASGAALTVSVEGPEVRVAARRGDLSVATTEGYLIASVQQGRTMAFDASAASPAGAAAPSQVSGCLAERDGHYFLKDTNAGVEIEIVAEDLASLVGHEVHATGSILPAKGPEAPKIMHALTVKDGGSTCSAGPAKAGSSAGKATGAGKAAGGAAKAGATGAALGAKTVIFGIGIAAAATATGLGIAAAASSSKEPISR